MPFFAAAMKYRSSLRKAVRCVFSKTMVWPVMITPAQLNKCSIRIFKPIAIRIIPPIISAYLPR